MHACKAAQLLFCYAFFILSIKLMWKGYDRHGECLTGGFFVEEQILYFSAPSFINLMFNALVGGLLNINRGYCQTLISLLLFHMQAIQSGSKLSFLPPKGSIHMQCLVENIDPVTELSSYHKQGMQYCSLMFAYALHCLNSSNGFAVSCACTNV